MPRTDRVTVDLAKAATVVRDGGIVAYPTETVYGLGADATQDAAVRALCRLKHRDLGKGLSVLVGEAGDLERWTGGTPTPALRIAARFWPGPVTVVIPVRTGMLSAVVTELGVGFRCSSHPKAAALARAAEGPLVSTSCNLSGQPPCRSSEEVARRFGEGLPVVEGEAGGGVPSTVIAVSADGEVSLLREGAIPFDRILMEVRA